MLILQPSCVLLRGLGEQGLPSSSTSSSRVWGAAADLLIFPWEKSAAQGKKVELISGFITSSAWASQAAVDVVPTQAPLLGLESRREVSPPQADVKLG